MSRQFLLVISVLFSSMTLSACTAVSLVDAAASAVVDTASLAVDITTTVVGAVIPDSDDD